MISLPRSLLLSPILLLCTAIQAAPQSCADKERAILGQLEEARAHGNEGRTHGLEKALRAVREHCTEEGLRQERQADYEAVQAEVQERQADLREAQQGGDPGKIEKRTRKLEEAVRELEALERQ
ncbi:DUF1090 domain-containing protein [Stutzerimonas kirkiae]|uniref:DUF1090 domain-containing protein n=1 Tax=Stutzerimonas kirkiae TaxID=2211392 RepID=UPI00103853C1|nr:DUF1090 domain-containing protein [Stutzerimonas kirkiae]TBV05135.1 DUF1090 domain-containing protein [Stutzerimonas kirkiae]TBV11854.1 DUF1090 domain-containing protein [Stutzerimonas kirkiae]